MGKRLSLGRLNLHQVEMETTRFLRREWRPAVDGMVLDVDVIWLDGRIQEIFFDHLEEVKTKDVVLRMAEQVEASSNPYLTILASFLSVSHFATSPKEGGKISVRMTEYPIGIPSRSLGVPSVVRATLPELDKMLSPSTPLTSTYYNRRR